MNIIETRLDRLLLHIEHVRNNCETLGKRLIDKGQIDLGVELIARGHVHDNSKFYGIEWLYLHSDIKQHNPSMFKEALIHHHLHNSHHPEFYDSIHSMKTVDIAEFCCDITARSSETGKDVMDWIHTKAMVKYNFSKESIVYKNIEDNLNLLLERVFI